VEAPHELIQKKRKETQRQAIATVDDDELYKQGSHTNHQFPHAWHIYSSQIVKSIYVKFRSAESQATHEVQFVGISCTVVVSGQIFEADLVDIHPSGSDYMVTSLGLPLLMWSYYL
jgi:hypothetical protein